MFKLLHRELFFHTRVWTTVGETNSNFTGCWREAEGCEYQWSCSQFNQWHKLLPGCFRRWSDSSNCFCSLFKALNQMNFEDKRKTWIHSCWSVEFLLVRLVTLAVSVRLRKQDVLVTVMWIDKEDRKKRHVFFF